MCVSIADDDSGIPESVEPFLLVETTKPRGAGLGLAIAQRQAMEAAATMQAGSPEKQSLASGLHSNAVACHALTVLVIDDEAGFRSGLVGNLRDDGHPVIECQSPVELPRPEMLASVGAVMMAYHHPGADWLAFACLFHRVHPQIPIVLFTAQWAPPLERAAREIGFVVYKPIQYELLHDFLHRLTVTVDYLAP